MTTLSPASLRVSLKGDWVRIPVSSLAGNSLKTECDMMGMCFALLLCGAHTRQSTHALQFNTVAGLLRRPETIPLLFTRRANQTTPCAMFENRFVPVKPPQRSNSHYCMRSTVAQSLPLTSACLSGLLVRVTDKIYLNF